MAGSNRCRITLKGRQTHGAEPWRGVDRSWLARRSCWRCRRTEQAGRRYQRTFVLTISAFDAGNRQNIIPGKAAMGHLAHVRRGSARVHHAARNGNGRGVAKSGGAEPEVGGRADGYVPVVKNIPLTQRIAPTLERVAGKLIEAPRVTGSEDFSFFARQVPGLFFFVGVIAPGTLPLKAAPNHSPRFQFDEAGLMAGLRSTLH